MNETSHAARKSPQPSLSKSGKPAVEKKHVTPLKKNPESAAKPSKKEDSLSSFTSDDEVKPSK